MKRLKILIAVLVIAVALFFVFRKDINHTAEIAPTDFAIPYDGKIDKIFYSSNNKKLGYLTFTLENKIWWVNNGSKKYKADTGSVYDLLKFILPKLEVHSPVSDAALPNVNREMSISAVKAQFYSGSKEIKTMYVGSKTPDDLGTYMYLPGTKKPCIVKIPGHNGYVTPYFNVDINLWRTLTLLDVPSVQISKISVDWAEEPQNGFTLVKDNDNPYLLDKSGNRTNAGRNKLLAYLDMFSGLTREAGEMAGINKTISADSILLSKPFFSVKITKTDGNEEILDLYRRKVSSQTYSPETRDGDLKMYETETYWGSLRNSKEIWVVQDIVVKNRMKKISDFVR